MYAHELLELKKEEAAAHGASAEHVYLWDQSYYTQMQTERQKAHGDNLSEFFELHHTLTKLLLMFEHLFATRFELITPEDQKLLIESGEFGEGPLVWDEEVMMFSVWDGDTDEFMGYAYFDFHPRPERASIPMSAIILCSPTSPSRMDLASMRHQSWK